MAKRQQPGCGCCGTTVSCSTSCSPCAIPTQDLTLTKTPGPTVSTLVYSSTGPTWSDGSYTLQCSGGNTTLTGPGGPWSQISSTCSPYQIKFGAGSVVSTIDGGATTGSICCQAFDINGCNNLALPGASVKIYDSSGGTLLTSGTTNSSGRVTLLWTKASSPCTVWVEVSYPTRFTTDANTRTLTSGGTTNIVLSAATGYVCCGGTVCAIPLATTLYLTIAGNTYTLTYDSVAIEWWGTATHTDTLLTAVGPFPACTCTTASGSQTVLFIYSCFNGVHNAGLTEGFGYVRSIFSPCGANLYTGITYTSPSSYSAVQPPVDPGCSAPATVGGRSVSSTPTCGVPPITGTMTAGSFGPPITGAFTITE